MKQPLSTNQIINILLTIGAILILIEIIHQLFF
jgi:hypothetical protein